MTYLEYVGSNENRFLKWLKLTLFILGALVAIPMLVVAFIAILAEWLTHKYISWLVDVTDTDVNFN